MYTYSHMSRRIDPNQSDRDASATSAQICSGEEQLLRVCVCVCVCVYVCAKHIVSAIAAQRIAELRRVTIEDEQRVMVRRGGG